MSGNEKTNYDRYREGLMDDPEFKSEYDALKPVYDLIGALVRYRVDNGISQEELAQLIGTKQSSISRFESSGQLPSFSFIKKIAQALDLELEFHIKPKTA